MRKSRTKGHSFERAVAAAFRAVFPAARRQLEYHEDDCHGVDLSGTGRYRVQCKRFKGYAPLTAIEEVQCDELYGEVPVLVTRGDNKRALACLPLEEFLYLLKQAGVRE